MSDMTCSDREGVALKTSKSRTLWFHNQKSNSNHDWKDLLYCLHAKKFHFLHCRRLNEPAVVTFMSFTGDPSQAKERAFSAYFRLV